MSYSILTDFKIEKPHDNLNSKVFDKVQYIFMIKKKVLKKKIEQNILQHDKGYLRQTKPLSC